MSVCAGVDASPCGAPGKTRTWFGAGAPVTCTPTARSPNPSPLKSGTEPQLPVRPLSRAGMVSSQTAEVRPLVVALETRQYTTPGGSGCGGCAGEPVAANETMTSWQARSRQTSTVAPVVELSGSQVKNGLIDTEIAVDSGAMSRGAVRGDPDPEAGVDVGGVGVGDAVGVEVGVDVGALESGPDARVSVIG